MTAPRPPKNDWSIAAIVLTVVGMLINGFAAYNTFNSNVDKRLQRLEDRSDIMWNEWVARHGR